MLDLERRANNVLGTAPLAFAGATALNLSGIGHRGPGIGMSALATGMGTAVMMTAWESTVNYNKNQGRKTEIVIDTFVMGGVIGGVSALLLMPLQ